MDVFVIIIGFYFMTMMAVLALMLGRKSTPEDKAIRDARLARFIRPFVYITIPLLLGFCGLAALAFLDRMPAELSGRLLTGLSIIWVAGVTAVSLWAIAKTAKNPPVKSE
jgi:hypothetical protein